MTGRNKAKANKRTIAKPETILRLFLSHRQENSLVNAKKAAGATPPSYMEAVWHWEHEKMIDKTAHVHRLLDMIKA